MTRHRDIFDELEAERERRRPGYRELAAAVEMASELASSLRLERQRRALSQTELARRIGTSQRIVSKLENGGSVNLVTLCRYAQAVGWTLRLGPQARAAAPRKPRRPSSSRKASSSGPTSRRAPHRRVDSKAR